MTRLTYFVVLTVAVLGVLPIAARARQAEAEMEFRGDEIQLDLLYAQRVSLRAWDEPRIRAVADVDLEDRRGRRDDDFEWRLSERGGVAEVIAHFGKVKAKTVLLRDGTDLGSGIPEDSMVTGTDVTIWLPRGVVVDAESSTAIFEIDHNGGALLVNTIGGITVRLDARRGATVSASTMTGEISVAGGLEFEPLSREGEEGEVRFGRQVLLAIGEREAELSLVSIVGTIRIEPLR